MKIVFSPSVAFIALIASAPFIALPLLHSAPASSIVGKWQMVTVSATSYNNTVTGASTPGFGGVMTYTFFSGGRYKMTSLIKMGSYTGESTYFTSKVGTYRLSGNKLTTHETSGTFDSQGIGTVNRKRPATGKDLKTQTCTYKLAVSNGKPVLVLGVGNKDFVTYKKQ